MKKILIIRFSALGDIAMTVPVVYDLATQYPDFFEIRGEKRINIKG